MYNKIIPAKTTLSELTTHLLNLENSDTEILLAYPISVDVKLIKAPGFVGEYSKNITLTPIYLDE